jgi:predicted nuclease of predicted toxin-antitoxin system
MRFKVDESLHVEVADLLRGQGHDALTVFDQGFRGLDDHDVADMCRSEDRVLLSRSGLFEYLDVSPGELSRPNCLAVTQQGAGSGPPHGHQSNGAPE